MSWLFIQSETLTSMADAIRERGKIEGKISPLEMADKIEQIDMNTDVPPRAFEESTISQFSSDATLVLDYAFYMCRLLQSVNLPMASYIGGAAFYYCDSLQSVKSPKISYIDDNAFNACALLKSIDLPNVSYIKGGAFRGCYNLLSLYLGSTSVCSLGATNAFSSTPIGGYTTSTGGIYGSIYVPASLYSDYINATNWTVFSSRFVSI